MQHCFSVSLSDSNIFGGTLLLDFDVGFMATKKHVKFHVKHPYEGVFIPKGACKLSLQFAIMNYLDVKRDLIKFFRNNGIINLRNTLVVTLTSL